MKSFTSGSVLIAIFLALAPAAAQDITGTPGSPSATTTIPGDQLIASREEIDAIVQGGLSGVQR